MTSPGLGELKRLINEATTKKVSLLSEVEEREARLARAKSTLELANRFVIRLFTRSAVPRLQSAADEAFSLLQEASADLAACHINLDFGLDQQSESAFAALSRSFANLCATQKLWDVTTTYKTDRAKERTTATQSIERTEVRFEFSDVDLLRSDFKAMKLNNASSLEMYLFPGFVLTKERGSDFALMEWKDISLDARPSNFIEKHPLPTDCEVVGHTWAKSNKDGSPDRRFADNYQIPIARYGELWFESPSGLYEAYMISSLTNAEDFFTAVQNYRLALSKNEQQPVPPTSDHDEERDELPSSGSPTPVLAKPPLYILDILSLAITVALFLGCAYWIAVSGPAILQRLTAQPVIVPEQGVQQQIAEPEHPTVFVTARVLNIRAHGAANSPIVLRVKRETKLREYRTEGAWSEVGISSPLGWAATRLLSRTPISSN